jgi:hypothetical protein
MHRSDTQELLIPYIGEPLLSDNQGIERMIKNGGSSLSVDKINWQEYPFQPIVQVTTGYSQKYLWLLYEVAGDFFRAKALADQEAVWEDACVEFFMSADERISDDNYATEAIIYRNFEFNALGVCLSAVGSKSQRAFLTDEEMKQILRFPVLTDMNLPEEGAEFFWNLVVAIPMSLLGIGPGSSFRANFYKCGDLTRKSHFLSWNGIDSADPDFHLPRYFGKVKLIG